MADGNQDDGLAADPKVIARAWHDSAFKANLLGDPYDDELSAAALVFSIGWRRLRANGGHWHVSMGKW